MIKALFFDIDGTLVSFKTHSIPVSTVEALSKAKAAGIKIFIATGRPVAIIDNLGAIEHLIDGYVTTNGAYCFVKDDIIVCNPILQDDVKMMAQFADEKRFACVYVGVKHIVIQNPNELLYKIFTDYLNVRNFPENEPLETIFQEPIIQMTPIISVDVEKEVMSRLKGCISGRWHHEFTDITANGADKGEGIAAVASHFGIEINETMAFGDGGNDVAMLKRAGVGVAMGNANESIRAQADYVTTSVDDDGIRNALVHWNVIEK